MPVSPRLHDDWLRGAALSGVEFAPRARVRVTRGRHFEAEGTVIDLLAANVGGHEPMVVFMVETSTGDMLELDQTLLEALPTERRE